MQCIATWLCARPLFGVLFASMSKNLLGFTAFLAFHPFFRMVARLHSSRHASVLARAYVLLGPLLPSRKSQTRVVLSPCADFSAAMPRTLTDAMSNPSKHAALSHERDARWLRTSQPFPIADNLSVASNDARPPTIRARNNLID